MMFPWIRKCSADYEEILEVRTNVGVKGFVLISFFFIHSIEMRTIYSTSIHEKIIGSLFLFLLAKLIGGKRASNEIKVIV